MTSTNSKTLNMIWLVNWYVIGQLMCDWSTVIGWYLPEQFVVPLQCILTNMFEPELFLQSWSVSTLSHGQYLTCGLSCPGLNTWLERVGAQCGLQLRGESGNISIDSVHDHSSSIVHPTNVLKHTNLVWNNFSTMIMTIIFYETSVFKTKANGEHQWRRTNSKKILTSGQTSVEEESKEVNRTWSLVRSCLACSEGVSKLWSKRWWFKTRLNRQSRVDTGEVSQGSSDEGGQDNQSLHDRLKLDNFHMRSVKETWWLYLHSYFNNCNLHQTVKQKCTKSCG